MPVVPITQRRGPVIPESMMPDETHFAMAAAELLAQAPTIDKSSHEATSKKLDSELSGAGGDVDVSHAEIKSGDEWNRAVMYNGKLIDPTKLSPKALKETGIKY